MRQHDKDMISGQETVRRLIYFIEGLHAGGAEFDLNRIITDLSILDGQLELLRNQVEDLTKESQ